jgi:hypothetical protein
MVKAIISRDVLYKVLNEQLPTKMEYKLSFHPQGCKIDDIDIAGIGSAKHEVNISYKTMNRLWKLLTWCDEQPITVAVDDSGWFYIKELIL